MARFLVVDKDHETVSGLSRLLVGDGHEVATFTTGAEALSALARESFDAVLTDLEMPDVDGRAVVRASREHHPMACVVIVTASPEKVDGLADVCSVADKPFAYDEITKHVAACRARGGRGIHGRCHLRSRGPEELRSLRRK